MRNPFPAVLVTGAVVAVAACVPALPGSTLQERVDAGSPSTGTAGATAGVTGSGGDAGAQAGTIGTAATSGSGHAAAGGASGKAGSAAGTAGPGSGGGPVADAGPVMDAPPRFVVLTENAGSPRNLVVDERFVYWANQTQLTLLKIPVEGGAPSALAPLNSRGSWVATDGESLYWIDGPSPGNSPTQIFKVAIGGGPPMLVVSNNTGYINEIAANVEGVFWTMSDGRVVKVARSGGGPMVLASGQNNPNAITADATTVCWVNADGTVMRVGTAGGSPIAIASWPPADPLFPSTPYMQIPNVASDGKLVYWGKLNGAVMMVGLGGGGSPMFAFAFGSARTFTTFVLDPDGIYAADSTGVVRYLKNASPGIEWNVGDGGGIATAVATDPGNVYWAISGVNDRILKASK